MKRLIFSLFLAIWAICFAAVALPALGAESGMEAPRFYQSNVVNCTAQAGVIGSVTATVEYYWDSEAKENVVAAIMYVNSDLPSGYEGDASHTKSTVIVMIKTYYGARVETAYCKV